MKKLYVQNQQTALRALSCGVKLRAQFGNSRPGSVADAELWVLDVVLNEVAQKPHILFWLPDSVELFLIALGLNLIVQIS